jgi:hypothetical protein
LRSSANQSRRRTLAPVDGTGVTAEGVGEGVAVVPPGAVGSAEGGLVDLSVQAAASKTAAAAAAKSVRRPIRRPAEERDPSGSCRGAEGMSAILTKHAVSTPVKCSPATSRWIFDRDTA